MAHSHLLDLPLELRLHIFSYILPSSTTSSTKSTIEAIVWRRAHHIPLLQTNRSILSDCLSQIYGTNTFMIDISFDSIRFRHISILPSGVTPVRALMFILPTSSDDEEEYDPGDGASPMTMTLGLGKNVLKSEMRTFPAVNIPRVRNYLVNIDHVDSYTGMIKYNCGGPGLTDGLRRQIARFVKAVGGKESELNSLRVRLNDGNRILSQIRRVKVLAVERHRDIGGSQMVLEPLKELRARRAEVSGDATEEYARRLKREIMGYVSNG